MGNDDPYPSAGWHGSDPIPRLAISPRWGRACGTPARHLSVVRAWCHEFVAGWRSQGAGLYVARIARIARLPEAGCSGLPGGRTDRVWLGGSSRRMRGLIRGKPIQGRSAHPVLPSEHTRQRRQQQDGTMAAQEPLSAPGVALERRKKRGDSGCKHPGGFSRSVGIREANRLMRLAPAAEVCRFHHAYSRGLASKGGALLPGPFPAGAPGRWLQKLCGLAGSRALAPQRWRRCGVWAPAPHRRGRDWCGERWRGWPR